MTQEQYERTCQIHRRLTDLADVKKRIGGKPNEKTSNHTDKERQREGYKGETIVKWIN